VRSPRIEAVEMALDPRGSGLRVGIGILTSAIYSCHLQVRKKLADLTGKIILESPMHDPSSKDREQCICY